MYCKYCGKKIEENDTFCNLCGKNIIKQGRSDNNKYTMNSGIIYITPKTENPYESWYYNEVIKNGGRFF